jgi:hypothetical protein
LRDSVKDHIIFDKTNWIKSSPKRLHAFLEALSISQMWDHFILEREKLVEAVSPYPASAFESLVDRIMLQPIPDSNARIDGFKSFVKDRFDKAAKLALEYVQTPLLQLQLSHRFSLDLLATIRTISLYRPDKAQCLSRSRKRTHLEKRRNHSLLSFQPLPKALQRQLNRLQIRFQSPGESPGRLFLEGNQCRRLQGEWMLTSLLNRWS